MESDMYEIEVTKKEYDKIIEERRRKYADNVRFETKVDLLLLAVETLKTTGAESYSDIHDAVELNKDYNYIPNFRTWRT